MQQRLRPFLPGARWVQSEGMHITMKFFGSVPEEQLSQLKAACAPIAFSYQRFSFYTEGLGGAPSLHAPRVVWVSCELPEPLTALARELEAAAEPLGYRREQRQFRAHITLARLERRLKLELPPEEITFCNGELIPVDHVTLFRSHTGPGGSRYEALDRWPLAL